MSKFFITALIVTSISLGIIAANALNKQSESNTYTSEDHQLFQSWKIQQSKAYSSSAEHQYRLNIFLNNVETIKAHNEKESSWTMGVNLFADLTTEEFRAQKLGVRIPQEELSKNVEGGKCPSIDSSKLPESVDHTVTGGVAPVTDQKKCGSCWAFSATASIEFCHWKKTRRLLQLSQQELVDCATGIWGDLGCNGGWPARAFRYVHSEGQMLNEDYPYVGKDERCKKDKRKVVATTEEAISVQPKCPSALMKAASERVVSVLLDAESFRLYKTGIMDSSSCGIIMDHAVNLVGYGTDEKGNNFYKIRNSWTDSWGEDGYIRIANDMKEGTGPCGILQQPTYPTC